MTPSLTATASVLPVPATGGVDALLGGDVLAHLDSQLESGRQLLATVLAQGAAIRGRNVDEVVRRAGELQARLQHRQRLEQDRARLLERAGVRLGIPPGAVTVELLGGLMDPGSAQLAAARSAELRGLLSELEREHACNRALMGQELAFLDHLLRLVDGDSGSGYGAGGERAGRAPVGAARQRIINLEA
jgi:hypothetical protein